MLDAGWVVADHPRTAKRLLREANVEVFVRLDFDVLGGPRERTRLAVRSSPAWANDVLCRLVAKQLRIAPWNVAIIRGVRSREKLLGVGGMDQQAVNAAFGIWHD